MERMENKIDKIVDGLGDIRVLMAKMSSELETATSTNTVRDKDILSLKTEVETLKTKVTVIDALASRKSVMFANVIAFVAAAGVFIPLLIQFARFLLRSF